MESQPKILNSELILKTFTHVYSLLIHESVIPSARNLTETLNITDNIN